MVVFFTCIDSYVRAWMWHLDKTIHDECCSGTVLLILPNVV